MNKKIYLGIDNGLDGALTFLQDNKIIEKIVMPTLNSTKNKREYDIPSIISFLSKYQNTIAVIEKAHAMPKIGSVQAFNFGKGYGIIIGIISTLKIPYQIVHAKTWQKRMFRDINYKDTKQASILIAQRLFPDEDFRPTERCKKAHHGLTDSALLCFYLANYHFEK